MNHIINIASALVIILSSNLTAQSNSPLDDYIREGLKNNLVLQQKKISLEKAVYALRSATSLFFPSVAFQASYTSGAGGRSIDIPVGDLMNPVYQTLNQLTGSSQFPLIQNVTEDFFPNKFYDVRIRASLPVVNTDIIFNRKIQNGRAILQGFELELYKRELIKEIKIAYYNFLSSLEAIKIYDSALNLAQEGKRVNESLLKNGSGLPVYLLRSDSEIENLNALSNESRTKSINAEKYFNFLLNRDLNSQVTADTAEDITNVFRADKPAPEAREEIKMLIQGIEISKSLLHMNQYYWIPKVSSFIDLGAQDSKWNYNRDSRYYLFGFQLEIPIFEGFRNRNKIEMAYRDLHIAEFELQNINRALHLSISVATDELLNAITNYQSSLKQAAVAQNYNRLITKGYQEGVNSFIETVDARNQLTSAQLLVNINKYRVLIAKANYERETASIHIN